jgi:hypothetical protein
MKIEYLSETDEVLVDIEYPYYIDMDEIKNWKHLLQWVRHLCEKSWFKSIFVPQFIEVVCTAKGWDFFSVVDGRLNR